ncbi:MAG TPA: TerB family tellurite resistance protein [Puia sp.]|nr:TerB family tellurite resistance protein [Puia sp.]
MKRMVVLILTVFGFGALNCKAQSYELQRLILDIEKLAQLKSMLTDLEKGYQILEMGYTTIKNISAGNFNLHKAFLDGLLAVSPSVQKYYKIAEIIQYQSGIVSEYKAALNRFRQDRHFNPDEIVYIGNVYDNLVDKSARNLESLLNVLTAGKLRMNDAQRLQAIDGIYGETKNQFLFLRQFNNSTQLLAVNRSVEAGDAKTLKSLYGIE